MVEILIAVGVIVGVGIVMGLILALANKYLIVKEDPRYEEIIKMMPGVNCGACGFPGCGGLAKSLVEGKTKKVTTCAVLKKEKAEQIRDYLNTTPDQNGDVLKTEI